MKPTRLAPLVLLVAAMSCSDAVSPTRKTITDLESARQLWHQQNLHTYAYTIQSSCFCVNVHPRYVFVLNDKVAGVLDLETLAPLDKDLYGGTIEDLFTFVQKAVDQHAETIRAQYDATKGFPTAIDYDGAAQIADDEVSIRVSDVHPVSPPSP
jgi:hypothetical protein